MTYNARGPTLRHATVVRAHGRARRCALHEQGVAPGRRRRPGKHREGARRPPPGGEVDRPRKRGLVKGVCAVAIASLAPSAEPSGKASSRNVGAAIQRSSSAAWSATSACSGVGFAAPSSAAAARRSRVDAASARAEARRSLAARGERPREKGFQDGMPARGDALLKAVGSALARCHCRMFSIRSL